MNSLSLNIAESNLCEEPTTKAKCKGIFFRFHVKTMDRTT